MLNRYTRLVILGVMLVAIGWAVLRLPTLAHDPPLELAEAPSPPGGETGAAVVVEEPDPEPPAAGTGEPQATSKEEAGAAPSPAPPPPAPPREAERPAPKTPPSRKSGSAQNAAQQRDLNTYVLEIIDTYRGKSYPYLLNNDYANYNGVTQDIVYQGQTLLKAHPSGNRASHCVGITFEVFFRAMQQRNRQAGLEPDDFNGMDYADLEDMILTWYVAKGPKSESNLALAVERYGLGRRITNLESVRAGDFIDFSRTNRTGHAAVFIDWVRQGGEIVGLKYWSSQGSTGGISYRTEYFNVPGPQGELYGNVIKDRLYIARVGPIASYRSLR
jgi:hypothetical protein